MGRAAYDAACSTVREGNAGAGTGARVGGLKGGIGTASVSLENGTTVGALVAVNAVGSAVDPVTGELFAARHCLPGDLPALGLPDAIEVDQAPGRDRKSVGRGKSVSGRLNLGGRRPH